MARPQGITDDEVLAAARAVFLAKGISATVEEVAERCHVGVATIFRRFSTKAELFTAAMTVSNDAEWERYLARRAEQGDDVDAREVLMELAKKMLDSSRKMMPLFMMKMSNPSISDREASVKRAWWLLGAIADLFKEEMAAGRMVAMDPRVAARIWLGAIRHVATFETLGANVDGLSHQEFLDGLVDMFCVPTAKSPKKSR
jgi:AcrR family transcriptional regulator